MTDFWVPDVEELAEAARARAFWEPTAEELFDQTQACAARLTAHRYAVRRESPGERARRQQHRAEQMAHELGSTRPNVVKAMLHLVIADEMIHPKGEPPLPVAPGARVTPKAPAKTSSTARVATGREARGPGDTGRSSPAAEPLRNATPEPPAQMGFWE